MRIIPSIDLKDGRCVRLLHGEFETVHTVADDPVAVARRFAAEGAGIIHVVDLDGARSGDRKNAEIVREIVEAARPARVELGGGLRRMTDLEEVFAWGVWRVIVGSAAVEDPDFIRAAVARYGSRLAVAIDTRNGEVQIHGWEQGSGLVSAEVALSMERLGVQCLILTDIERDGTLSGPSFGALTALRSAVSCELVASGGIASQDDLRRLREAGVDGAIVGKATYTGAVNIREAFAALEDERRIVVALDCKNGRVVKGIQFSGLRDAGDPVELARRYSEDGADEIVFLDISASVEGRETTLEMARRVARSTTAPFSVSGGIRSVEGFGAVLSAGAGKAAIGSAAVKNSGLITACAEKYGRRRVSVTIDAEWNGNFHEVRVGMGRENTGLDAVAWASEVEKLGAGELLVTSVRTDGAKDGYDIPLLRTISEQVTIPVTASGGCGGLEDFYQVFTETRCRAALAASVFHFGDLTVEQVKKYLRHRGIPVVR